MLLISGDNAADRAFYEELSTLSGRPMIMNVIQAFDHRPEIHRRGLAWLKSCRERGIRVVGQGLTTDAGFTFTFEDWNLFDDSQDWCDATTGTREERLAKLADPARRAKLRENLPITATGPLPQIAIVGPKTETQQEVARLHAGPCRREDGQASGRRHARHGGRGESRDRVLCRPAQRQHRVSEGAGRRSLHPVRRVRRRRPHQVPDGRPLSDRDDLQGGSRSTAC